MTKTWTERLRDELPRSDIPVFLGEIQRLVEALRNGSDWELSDLLRAHEALVLEYLTPGPKRDAVKRAM